MREWTREELARALDVALRCLQSSYVFVNACMDGKHVDISDHWYFFTDHRDLETDVLDALGPDDWSESILKIRGQLDRIYNNPEATT